VLYSWLEPFSDDMDLRLVNHDTRLLDVLYDWPEEGIESKDGLDSLVFVSYSDGCQTAEGMAS